MSGLIVYESKAEKSIQKAAKPHVIFYEQWAMQSQQLIHQRLLKLDDTTNQQNDAPTTATTTTKPDDLPMVIQDLMECGIVAMDVEEIGVVSAAAPMVDDDNEPAPENCPLHGENDGQDLLWMDTFRHLLREESPDFKECKSHN